MTIYINRLLKISIALISFIHKFDSEIIQTYLKETVTKKKRKVFLLCNWLFLALLFCFLGNTLLVPQII